MRCAFAVPEDGGAMPLLGHREFPKGAPLVKQRWKNRDCSAPFARLRDVWKGVNI
jgi:hypothetical protein